MQKGTLCLMHKDFTKGGTGLENRAKLTPTEPFRAALRVTLPTGQLVAASVLGLLPGS
jgi:hypothetical protein